MADFPSPSRSFPKLKRRWMIKCNWNRIYSTQSTYHNIFWCSLSVGDKNSVCHLTDLFYLACFGQRFESFMMDVVFNIRHFCSVWLTMLFLLLLLLHFMRLYRLPYFFLPCFFLFFTSVIFFLNSQSSWFR